MTDVGVDDGRDNQRSKTTGGRVTIRDVAQEAGVSMASASRALNGKGELSETTRQAVIAAAQRLRYVPSEVARALLSGRTMTIGVVITDNSSSVYAEVVRGVEHSANELGYSVLLTNSADSVTRAVTCIRTLWAKDVDGILWTPVQGGEEADALEMTRAQVPFVCLVRYMPALEHDFVVTDNIAGGEMATRHLLDLGHQQIAHIGGKPGLSPTDDRVTGYVRALRARHYDIPGATVLRGEHTIESGYALAQEILGSTSRPTAIYTATAQQAVGVLEACRQLDVSVPGDLAVVAGDEVELAAFVSTPLTTVQQPSFDIGVQGTKVLFDRLAGETAPVRAFLKPRLNVRASSGSGDSTVHGGWEPARA